MSIFSGIVLLFLMIFGISFAVLNSNIVVLDYYFGKYDVSLSLLLVFTLGVGAILGFTLMTPSLFRLKLNNRKLKHRINSAQTELDNLRSNPTRNSH